ncbi:hypothetical protein O6H91_17G061500 [Diphasiastrum complanatum]|uniref:Uncharacterized protein n=1 Tax=Diphasiastrum complanatum TaxID=34168 RepID=A0ACC2B8C6_DIPCM|nr:hypothetical protein O6H91_17G061500 [Diphasiastrum complanatum]
MSHQQDKGYGEKASEGVQKTAEQVKEGVQKGGKMAMGDDQPQRMKEQTKGMIQKMRDKAPLNRNQVIGLISLLTGGTVLLVGGGLALAGTIITLIIASPLLLLASPVLIPIGIMLFLGTAGFLATGVTLLVLFSVVSSIYRYFKAGRSPVPGKDEVEDARQRLLETAGQLQERVREYGSNVGGALQSKVQEAAPGA